MVKLDRPRWRPIRTEKTNTIDQHLLAEIRDHLVALPLANTLKHEDVQYAERLRAELDDLHHTIARQAQTIALLQRAAGIDAEVLTDDELELLTELGART